MLKSFHFVFIKEKTAKENTEYKANTNTDNVKIRQFAQRVNPQSYACVKIGELTGDITG